MMMTLTGIMELLLLQQESIRRQKKSYFKLQARNTEVIIAISLGYLDAT